MKLLKKIAVVVLTSSFASSHAWHEQEESKEQETFRVSLPSLSSIDFAKINGVINHTSKVIKDASIALNSLLLSPSSDEKRASIVATSNTKTNPNGGNERPVDHNGSGEERLLERANFCTKIRRVPTWQSWSEDVSNFSPILRPKSDTKLKKIVRKAKRRGCNVRMMGARHSMDGMVVQRKEENMILVSLKSHTTSVPEWQDALNKETSTFRIGAGRSWYAVSALIRPHGYVLKSRSSSAAFSVGGVVANMVHGGGRDTGFMHDDVVKMLVLTSDGEMKEVEGNDLKYWRSSAGQLGMILAVEMKVHSEEIPYVIGIDPSTGVAAVDLEKGGLVMERETTTFPRAVDESDFTPFVMNVMQKIYTTHATYDSAQFFFGFYSNSLHEYRTNFSGPRFSGNSGGYPDQAKAKQYRRATKRNSKKYSNSAFTGGKLENLSVDILCQTLCVPPTGPLYGNKEPCIPLPSSSVENARLCDVPNEVAAVVSEAVLESLDGSWDVTSSAENDGFFVHSATKFSNAYALLPARALGTAFGFWYKVVAAAIAGHLPNVNYFPNASFECRFINPKETAVLNTTPTIEEVKAAFNDKYLPFYGPNAFDLLLPPLHASIPDGFVAIEMVEIRNINDEDQSKFLSALEQTFQSMPTNPLLEYSDSIVKECDVLNGIFPCQGLPAEGSKCCNPPIPVFQIHLGKGWGMGVDVATTPFTGKLQPFKDAGLIADAFKIGSKQNSIADFNEKRDELDANVFSGGSMMRWLSSPPHSTDFDFEVRKLSGQACDSPDFVADPNKECISDQCIESVCG